MPRLARPGRFHHREQLLLQRQNRGLSGRGSVCPCKAFGRAAETLAKHKKGEMVVVAGRPADGIVGKGGEGAISARLALRPPPLRDTADAATNGTCSCQRRERKRNGSFRSDRQRRSAPVLTKPAASCAIKRPCVPTSTSAARVWHKSRVNNTRLIESACRTAGQSGRQFKVEVFRLPRLRRTMSYEHDTCD